MSAMGDGFIETLLRLTDGAPASALLLATIVVVSLFGLTKAPQLVERNLLRPHGLVRRGDYMTLVTSGFIHVDFRAPGEPSYRWTDWSGHGGGGKKSSGKKSPTNRTQPARKPVS